MDIKQTGSPLEKTKIRSVLLSLSVYDKVMSLFFFKQVCLRCTVVLKSYIPP